MSQNKMALVLGGGAPNFTLMTGALLAFDEAGVKFEVVSSAGGGGVTALTYLAPKGMSRQDALKNSVNFGIADVIYKFLPMNYKIFQKGGVMADMFRGLLARMPGYNLVMDQSKMGPGGKLVSDVIQMWWAAMTPGMVTPFSHGLCAHAPFVKEMVDFERLKTVEEDFYLNAYNLTDHKMEIFDKSDSNFHHFGATLAYPFIYPPVKIGEKLYIEGAASDTFNFQGLLEYDQKIDTLVVFDSFSNEGYLQPPGNLWDAWAQSLITPLISLSRNDLAMAEHFILHWNEEHPDRQVKLIRVKFDVPTAWLPTSLDWSTSNLERNFALGYETGKKFVGAFGNSLGREARPAAAKTATKPRKKTAR